MGRPYGGCILGCVLFILGKGGPKGRIPGPKGREALPNVRLLGYPGFFHNFRLFLIFGPGRAPPSMLPEK